MLLGLKIFCKEQRFQGKADSDQDKQPECGSNLQDNRIAGNERLRQLDTKLLRIRPPQCLSRHLLDATTKLLWDKEAQFTSVLVKKGSRICTASQGAAIVHDSSPLIASKAISKL